MTAKQKRACPCCGFKTLRSGQGDYEICAVCFWEDDPVGYTQPDYAGGANGVSLIDAKKNFLEIGAVEARFVKEVRAPRPDETS